MGWGFFLVKLVQIGGFFGKKNGGLFGTHQRGVAVQGRLAWKWSLKGGGGGGASARVTVVWAKDLGGTGEGLGAMSASPM